MSRLKITSAKTNSEGNCCTCGRRPCDPFRIYVGGKIVNGCVDGCHTEQLTPISQSNDWHVRQEAEKIRRNMPSYRYSN